MKDKWLDDIHDRMAGFETDEPDNLWADLQKRLEKEKAVAPPALQRRNLLSGIRRYCAVAAILALIATTIIWMALPDNDVSLQIPHDGSSEIKKENSTQRPYSHDTPLHPAKIAQVYSKIPGQPATQSLTPTLYNDISISDNNTDTVRPTTAGTNSEIPEKADSASQTVPSSPSDGSIRPHRPESHNHYNTATYIRRQKHNNPGALSLSIYTAGALNSTINQSIMSGASTVPTSLDKSQWNDSHMLGVLLFNKGKEIQTKTKHYLPIRAGLSVGYRILPRLSVESGLTYSCLISDLSFGSESHYLSGSQTLHYIGLPLGIRYNAFSWKKFNLYAACGVMAEKCISGKTECKFILENKNIASESEITIVKPLQWSVSTSVGLQFNISSITSIYAEPGIHYYFSNNSSIKTIYQNRPLNFNLNLGLRFTFGND
ncbi:hypothetical protein [Muribaculum intestinale]|jgi:hypothetical protein|uniref:hypothetical protein n=1 Tax=Muribaculum intestinale TaxID=1796646 RepID=UPI002431D0F8|nr:hypothetical protein [Muribaculum intestinale]